MKYANENVWLSLWLIDWLTNKPTDLHTYCVTKLPHCAKSFFKSLPPDDILNKINPAYICTHNFICAAAAFSCSSFNATAISSTRIELMTEWLISSELEIMQQETSRLSVRYFLWGLRETTEIFSLDSWFSFGI